MNKKEFINELRKHLRSIKKQDRDEILEDYEEHFRRGKKQKRKELDIASSLGNPKEIAKEAKGELKGSLSLGGMANDTFLVVLSRIKEYSRMVFQGIEELFSKEIKQVKKEVYKETKEQTSEIKKDKKTFFAKLFSVLFNLLIGIWLVFAVYLTVGSLLISGWAITLAGVAAFAISIAGLFVELPYVNNEFIPMGIFAGISITSVGVLLSIFSWQTGKLFSKLISRYLRLNKKRKNKNE